MRIFTLLTMLFALNGIAQNQSGYYVDNSGNRTVGYFKTSDFYNEEALEFANASGGTYRKLDPRNIIEYGIVGQYKFRKYDVKVDRSEINEKMLSGNKEPLWEERTVFLSVIAEGDATLYAYKVSNGSKIFYTVKGKIEMPQQLVYKKYKLTETTIAENNQFRQQLFNNLNCGNQQADAFKSIKYEAKSIARAVETYNACSGSATVAYQNKTSKGVGFIYTLHAGVYNATFGIDGSYFPPASSNDINFSAGAEVAVRLPSEKLEFFLRADYEKLSGEVSSVRHGQFNDQEGTYKLDGSAFNVCVGPRYNFIFDEQNKLFVDGAVGMSLPSGEIVNTSYYTSPTGNYDGGTLKFKLTGTAYANFGVGYTFNDKYGICLRYDTNKNLFDTSFTTDKTKISRIGINLRYSL